MTPRFPPLIAEEKVLWEGQPDTQLRFGMETMATGIFAIALVLACLGMATVINRSMPGNFWVIFGPGLIVGAIIVLIVPWLDSRKRARTRYRLTNKRAIIQIGQTGNSYPIPTSNVLMLRDGDPPTVTFAQLPGNRRISFERIADAAHVHQLMQELALPQT